MGYHVNIMMHEAHSTEKVLFSNWCKIFSERRCFHVLAWYCV